jgi:hypothetical protein
MKELKTEFKKVTVEETFEKFFLSRFSFGWSAPRNTVFSTPPLTNVFSTPPITMCSLVQGSRLGGLLRVALFRVFLRGNCAGGGGQVIYNSSYGCQYK